MEADLAKRGSFRTDYKYVICGDYVVLYRIGEECVVVYWGVSRYQDIARYIAWQKQQDVRESHQDNRGTCYQTDGYDATSDEQKP